MSREDILVELGYDANIPMDWCVTECDHPLNPNVSFAS